jgi:hypothetical protein
MATKEQQLLQPVNCSIYLVYFYSFQMMIQNVWNIEGILLKILQNDMKT